MSVKIVEVNNTALKKEFVKFPIELYRNNTYYVPSLMSDEMESLNPDKNPAFDFCEQQLFLVYKEGIIAGRIAAIINHKANEIWEQKYVRFGFVDFIDDQEVVDALFSAVERWGKEKGMEFVNGPLGFTDMDKEGMLVDGFDQLGTMATIYNYPYYPKHMERMGLVKDQDWHEFKIYIPENIPEKHQRIGEIVKKKYGLEVKKFKNAKEVMPYAHKIFETLNIAFAPLYGFTPLTPRQIDYYVDQYIPMLRYEFVTLIVRTEDDAVVGFGISLPSMSTALQKAKGRMLPFGWYYLLKALKSRPKIIDLYLTGILPEYQNKGVNALLFNDLIPIYGKTGAEYAESNVELESNKAVQAQWDYFKREHHKTRRAYIKKIL